MQMWCCFVIMGGWCCGPRLRLGRLFIVSMDASRPPAKSTSRPAIRRARVGDGVDPAWMLERHIGLRGPPCRTPVSIHHVSRHILATNASSSPEVDPTCEKKAWRRSGARTGTRGRLYPTLGPLMEESYGSTNQV